MGLLSEPNVRVPVRPSASSKYCAGAGAGAGGVFPPGSAVGSALCSPGQGPPGFLSLAAHGRQELRFLPSALRKLKNTDFLTTFTKSLETAWHWEKDRWLGRRVRVACGERFVRLRANRCLSCRLGAPLAAGGGRSGWCALGSVWTRSSCECAELAAPGRLPSRCPLAQAYAASPTVPEKPVCGQSLTLDAQRNPNRKERSPGDGWGTVAQHCGFHATEPDI